MITDLLYEINRNLIKLNKVCKDKGYFKNLEEKMEMQNKYNQTIIDRINKAIDYIEDNCFDGKEYDTHGDMLNVEELLNILKGSDKE